MREPAGSASAILRALPGPGERPFIAALPQAALAHPQGPHLHRDNGSGLDIQLPGSDRAGAKPTDAFAVNPYPGPPVAELGLALHSYCKRCSRPPPISVSSTTPREAIEYPGALLSWGHRRMLRQDLAGCPYLSDPGGLTP